jgi:hypothetical protein
MNGNNRHLSKTILNVNGLNAPMKRYRTANWVKKQDSTICCCKRLISLKKKENNSIGLSQGGKKEVSKQMDTIDTQE